MTHTSKVASIVCSTGKGSCLYPALVKHNFCESHTSNPAFMVHARSSIYTALVTLSDHSWYNIRWEAVAYNPDLNLSILCKTQNSKSTFIVHFLWVVHACTPPLIVHINRRCTPIAQYSLCVDYERLMSIIQHSNK